MDIVAQAIDRLVSIAAKEHESANRYVEYIEALSTAISDFVEHLDPLIQNGDPVLRQHWNDALVRLTTTSYMIQECEVMARLAERGK